MKISKNLVIGILIVLVIIPLVMATLSTLIPHTTNNPSGSGYVTEGTYTIGTYTALTETCIGEVNSSNNVWCLENEGTNARDAYFKTNFTMPSGTINSILITGEGKSTSTSAGTCTLGLFNYTSGAWITKNSSSCTSTADVTLTYNISSSAEKTNFINGSIVQAMFVIFSTAVTDDLDLDYLGAQVDYTPPLDTCTYSSGNWALNCADNCIFTGTQTIAGKNNITITGTGSLTFNNGGKWSFTGTSQYITIASGCTLNINTGGGWNY